MNKRIAVTVLMLAFAAAVPEAFSQTGVKGDGIDLLGSVKDGVYRNSYFAFELNVPKGWTVIDHETSVAAMRVGVDVVKGKNKTSNRALEDSIGKEVVLLNVTKKPMGALQNAMFMMAVSKQPSKHVTPSMVAEATKSLFASSPTLKLSEDVEIRTVAGKKFACMEFVIKVGDQSATIKYYVTVIDEFALSFSLSYADAADFPELNKILDSLSFSAK